MFWALALAIGMIMEAAIAATTVSVTRIKRFCIVKSTSILGCPCDREFLTVDNYFVVALVSHKFASIFGG